MKRNVRKKIAVEKFLDYCETLKDEGGYFIFQDTYDTMYKALDKNDFKRKEILKKYCKLIL